MEAHSHDTNEGILETCTTYGGAGVFALVYTILALGFLLTIVIWG